MSIFEKIFSVKNICDDGLVKRKRITIAGMKINVKCKPSLHKAIRLLRDETMTLRNEFGNQRYEFGNQLDQQRHELGNQLEQQRQEILTLQEKLTTSEEKIKGLFTHSLSVYNLHQQVFPKYKNIHQGKEVVLVATGPTLKDYVPIENAIHIGVNRAFQFDKVKLDYYFLQDYGGFTPGFIQEAIAYQGNHVKKFFGILMHQFDFSLMKHILIPESKSVFADAERYYCHPFWDLEIPYDITTNHFVGQASVVFPALLFALWTNPKRIYLAGCDCTENGYFNNEEKNYLNIKPVIDGYYKFKEYAQIHYPDTEIISINPVGLEGLFNDIFIEEGKYVDSLSTERLDALMKSDDYATEFLKANKDERMDANRTDIFIPSRAAFHKDRYVFASQYISNKTVVDVASGTGYGADLMASRAKPEKIYGLEINAKAVAYAKSKYQSEIVEFKQGSITEMPFPDNFCDVLTSFETIEHVEDEHKQLQEIQRVLKPGGYYILSTPNNWGLTAHHVRDYDYDSIREIVGKYFAIEAVFNHNPGHDDGNQRFPGSIIPTTSDNYGSAQCFIIVARNVKDNVVINPADNIVAVLDTFKVYFENEFDNTNI